MTPKLSDAMEELVTNAPTGIVQVRGDRGTFYVLTEEAMNVRQYVQEGLDEADRGQTTPWDAAEIIQQARDISARRSV